MRVDREFLKSLDFGDGAIDAVLQSKPPFEGSMEEYLDLTDTTYEHKMWIVQELLTENQATKWVYMCAESVLDIYEEKYPGDYRIRTALQTTKNPLSTEEELRTAIDTVGIIAESLSYVDEKGYLIHPASACVALSAYQAIVTFVTNTKFSEILDTTKVFDYGAIYGVFFAISAASNKKEQESKNLELLKLVLKDGPNENI